MKTIGLIIALSVFSYYFSFAQDNREELSFGPKIGLNLANVYDSEGEEFDADPKFGLVVGVFATIPISPLFGFQPEILFSQKGFQASGNVFGSEYSYKRTLNYLDIPLLISLKPSPKFTILAGPQYSYLISQKDVFTNSLLNIEQEEEFENENLRKNTFGVLCGFDVNANRFTVGARAGWDLYNNNGDGTSTNPRYKNVWYQATVGYRL
jgi:hypothetical protein